MPDIESALAASIRVVLITGDADYICSWRGTTAVARALEWLGQRTFQEGFLHPYRVRGTEKGMYKIVDNLGMIIVENSGHNVPQYRKYIPCCRARTVADREQNPRPLCRFSSRCSRAT